MAEPGPVVQIIDRANPDFDDVPDTLVGEVLLERPAGPAGGWITCPVEVVHEFKQATAPQRAARGWGQYETGLAAIDTSGATLPPLAEYQNRAVERANLELSAKRGRSLAGLMTMRAQAKGFRGQGNPPILDYPLIEAEADIRGITPAEAAAAIEARADAVKAGIDALRAAPTLEAAIAVNFDLQDAIARVDD